MPAEYSVWFFAEQAAPLYLARALAHKNRAVGTGWGEHINEFLLLSINDLNRAEFLGLKDFRINMYRAVVLSQQKKYDAALEQINIAVSKSEKDPRVYINRYFIRDKLGQVKNRDNKTDPDWIKYKELMKTWVFEK